MNQENSLRYVVNVDALPSKFPTHRHDACFWEGLGRAVATFGFLEEILGRAIFALTATRPGQEDDLESAYAEWIPTLERALEDPLSGLTSSFEKAARQAPNLERGRLDELLGALKSASRIRNVLCHGSWQVPNAVGASIPRFVEKRTHEAFVTAVDLPFLEQVQRHTSEVACDVINTVTRLGWQFPGWASGPGQRIW